MAEVYIDTSVLVSLIKGQFASFSEGDSWFVDVKYKTLFFRDLPRVVSEWLGWLKENSRVWVADDYDCDDFAEDFRRLCVNRFYFVHPLLAVGKLTFPSGDWGYHAWNLIVTHRFDYANQPIDYRVWEFEPQAKLRRRRMRKHFILYRLIFFRRRYEP
jgi:hypothetical protein